MIRLLVGLALVACSGRHGPPVRPDPPPADAGPPVAEPAPSEVECDALLDHALALGVVDRAPDPPLDDAQRTQLRADLRTPFMAECRTMTRAKHRCALAAATMADLVECDEHASR